MNDARLGQILTRARYLLLPEDDIAALVAALQGGPVEVAQAALLAKAETAGRLVASMLASGWCGAPVDAADRVLVRLAGSSPALLRTFLSRVLPESSGWEELVRCLEAQGMSPEAVFAELLVLSAEWVDRERALTPLGQAVLDRLDADPEAFVRALRGGATGPRGALEGADEVRWAEAVELCFAAVPPRVEAAEALAGKAPAGQRGRLAATLLGYDPARFAALALSLAEGPPSDDRDAALGALVTALPEAALPLATRVALEPVRTTPGGVLPVQAVVLGLLASRDPGRWSEALLETVRAVPGPWALQALSAVPAEVGRAGLTWIVRHAGGHLALQALERLLVAPWPGRSDEALWALAHDDKAVRSVAAAAARGFDPTERGAVVGLLDDPRVEVRLEAARLLEGVDDPIVRDGLVRHHARERSPRVKAAMALALGRPGGGEEAPAAGSVEGVEGVPVVTGDTARAALVAALEAAAKGRTRGMLSWYAPGKLPALRWTDGTPAPNVAGLCLARWQIEHAQIDPAPAVMERVGDFDPASVTAWAVAMVSAWIDAGAPARDYGCLALAVALGQDASVPTVEAQIPLWFRASRGALGAEALHLLAALGTGPALRALDALAAGHPRESLGHHARQLLEAEARARGVEVEAMLDAAVPTFGMAADATLVIDNGTRKYTLVLDGWTPVLVDAIGRRHTTYARPSRPREGTKAATAWTQWRAVHEGLEAVVRRETARLEEALRNGRAWAAGQWVRDVAGHPVLRRLAAGLVWARDDGATFVADPEGLLRDPTGTATAPKGTLRLAHPVELASGVRVRWRALLAGRGTRGAVSQMERAVFLRTEADAGRAVYEGFAGRSLLAVSDKGHRVVQPWEAAGWSPLPTEAGLCRGFARRFGMVGVEAVVEVEGMALWAEFARQSPVVGLRFQRVEGAEGLRLGDVPLRVYSEALADVARMVGQ